MQFKVSSPKDFWTGLIYIGFGAVALWVGADYKMGTTGRMGPGYFPKVLAGLLITFGLVSVARSFITKGEPIGAVAWKPLFLILLSCALFGLLVSTAGVVVALFALILVSAAASREFRFEWQAVAGVAVLIGFCVLVFVKGLGVPMPIVGPWLEPALKPIVSRFG